jgi:invasion protein IalB
MLLRNPKLLFSAILFCLATHAEAAESSRFGDWQLVSSQENSCLLLNRIVSRKSGITVMEAILRQRSDGSLGATIGVRVPNGASLKDPIAYAHPKGPPRAIGLEWQSCSPEMCLAAGDISEDALSRLKRGSMIVVGFSPLTGSRKLNVVVSLAGLTRGWQALQSCQ